MMICPPPSIVCRWFSILLALLASSADADVITYTGTGGRFNQDSWNIATNWNNGAGPVPSGVVDVVIESGRTAYAQSSTTTTTPFFDGSLTLESNSILHMGLTSTHLDLDRALGTESISMHDGSQIIVRTHIPGGPNTTITEGISLLGDARIDLGISTSGANRTAAISGNISGAGKFGLGGTGGQRLELSGNNSFAGGLFAGDNDGAGFGDNLADGNNVRVAAMAANSLGAGDVQMGDFATLIIEAQNSINAQAELRLFGSTAGSFSKLILNEDLIVGRALIDGVSLANGLYDINSGLLDINGNNLISGTGTLQVGTAAVPEPSSIVLLTLGAFAWVRRARRINRSSS